MKVIPPNFGYVEEGIFRCGAPEPRHYGFLASLGLRTCILLTDTHDGAFVHWLQETGVMIFCPLSNEAQARGNFRGGPQAYSTANMQDNMSFAQPPPQQQQQQQQRSGRDGATSVSAQSASNATRDDGGRDDAASPNSNVNDGFGLVSNNGRGGPSDGSHSAATMHYADGTEGGSGGLHTNPDNADGRFDGSGNYTNEEALMSTYGGSRGGGWPTALHPPGSSSQLNNNGGGGGANNTNNGGAVATAGTSNAVRFLQENVAERQISTKFSPVLIQEPVYFPGGDGRNGGGAAAGNYGAASSNGGAPYQFISAPSYEGRLHGLMTLSEAVVVSILHILLDPHYYPLLITCSKGRYRSGIVCGCLRKLQGWNLVSILEEYRRFAGNKSRADNEEFIELFDEELVNLELSDGRRPTILYNV